MIMSEREINTGMKICLEFDLILVSGFWMIDHDESTRQEQLLYGLGLRVYRSDQNDSLRGVSICLMDSQEI